jgi:hypothetical protein
MPVVSSAAICEPLASPDAMLVALGSEFDHITRIWDELARQTNNSYDNVDIIGLIEKPVSLKCRSAEVMATPLPRHSRLQASSRGFPPTQPFSSMNLISASTNLIFMIAT